jgi:hypothetical protein
MNQLIPANKLDEFGFLTLGVIAISGMLSRSVVITLVVTTLFVLGFICIINLQKIKEYLRKRNVKAEPAPEPELEVKDDVALPVQPSTKTTPVQDLSKKIIIGKSMGGEDVAITMEEMGNTFVAGMTRYGKTRLLYALIAQYLKFDPSELQVAFCDIKRVSFNIFAASKHLYMPIAKTPEEIEALISSMLAEMYRRYTLFEEYAAKNICTNLDEYRALSGDNLPRIVIIFDELADSVEAGTDAEKNLTTLAKVGLAAGIHLVLSTQRPTVAGITNEVQVQCQTRFSTYMSNGMEYGSIAKIPKHVYQDMKPIKGRFMVFTPETAPFFMKENPLYGGWGFIQGDFFDNDRIERVAHGDISNSPLPLTTKVQSSPLPSWEGSQEDKFNALRALEDRLNRDIQVSDMCKAFNVSSKTARTWLDKYYS